MRKKATSLDVARLAGVSQSAVSSILNFNHKISFSDETRARVLNAAKQLGYTPPQKKAINREEKPILILVPTMSNQYYAEVGRTLETYAGLLGMKAIVCSTFRKRDLERYYLDLFLGIGISGIVYTFLPSHPDFVNSIDAIVPVVIIGGKEENLSICSIELNDTRAAMLLAEHLHGLGHRHFAYITTPIRHTTLARRLRLEGLQMSLKSFGLPGDAIQVVAPKEDFSVKEEDTAMQPYEYIVGRQLAQDLITQGSKATALIAVNDMTAIGVLEAVLASGYTVPEDYSVCGFDNTFISTITQPPLTTIDHQMSMRCKAAMDMVVARLRSDANATLAKADKIEYSPRLIIRESTGCARSKQGRDACID